MKTQTIFNQTILALSIALAFSGTAHAGPTGATFLKGAGTVTNPTATVTNISITATADAARNALINWKGGFNIAAPETVHFYNSTGNGSALNVINVDNTGTASTIKGSLQSQTGVSIYVVNPKGVQISATANIQTGGGFAAIAATIPTQTCPGSVCTDITYSNGVAIVSDLATGPGLISVSPSAFFLAESSLPQTNPFLIRQNTDTAAGVPFSLPFVHQKLFNSQIDPDPHFDLTNGVVGVAPHPGFTATGLLFTDGTYNLPAGAPLTIANSTFNPLLVSNFAWTTPGGALTYAGNTTLTNNSIDYAVMHLESMTPVAGPPPVLLIDGLKLSGNGYVYVNGDFIAGLDTSAFGGAVDFTPAPVVVQPNFLGTIKLGPLGAFNSALTGQTGDINIQGSLTFAGSDHYYSGFPTPGTTGNHNAIDLSGRTINVTGGTGSSLTIEGQSIANGTIKNTGDVSFIADSFYGDLALSNLTVSANHVTLGQSTLINGGTPSAQPTGVRNLTVSNSFITSPLIDFLQGSVDPQSNAFTLSGSTFTGTTVLDTAGIFNVRGSSFSGATDLRSLDNVSVGSTVFASPSLVLASGKTLTINGSSASTTNGLNLSSTVATNGVAGTGNINIGNSVLTNSGAITSVSSTGLNVTSGGNISLNGTELAANPTVTAPASSSGRASVTLKAAGNVALDNGSVVEWSPSDYLSASGYRSTSQTASGTIYLKSGVVTGAGPSNLFADKAISVTGAVDQTAGPLNADIAYGTSAITGPRILITASGITYGNTGTNTILAGVAASKASAPPMTPPPVVTPPVVTPPVVTPPVVTPPTDIPPVGIPPAPTQPAPAAPVQTVPVPVFVSVTQVQSSSDVDAPTLKADTVYVPNPQAAGLSKPVVTFESETDAKSKAKE